MHGAVTAMFPHSSLVRRFRPVYVTLDCKCWLAHELHFSTAVNSVSTHPVCGWGGGAGGSKQRNMRWGGLAILIKG
jgi:hypothetical protein